MSRQKLSQIALAAAVIAFSGIGYAHANKFSAELSGFEEVPAILTTGEGTLALQVQGNAVSYRLSYSGLEDVTQAHIHFGKARTNGGVMAWLCGNVAAAPPGTQPCPLTAGTVTGILTADDVVGPSGQNVTAGDFGALLAALESDSAYVNVHTEDFGSGEIRGQLQKGNRFGNR